MIGSKKRYPYILLLSVIIPAIVICILGIYFVSQQKLSRTLNLEDQLKAKLNQVRIRVEERTEQLVNKILSQVTKTKSDLEQPNSLLDLIKTIVIQYPLVKFPFIINNKQEFVFPLTPKNPVNRVKNPDISNIEQQAKYLYRFAADLELKEQNFTEALILSG